MINEDITYAEEANEEKIETVSDALIALAESMRIQMSVNKLLQDRINRLEERVKELESKLERSN